jgi:hypothetical protein
LKIFFDSTLDGRSWPIWSGDKKGRLGEVKVGQLGLLGFLESMLGLRGPVVSEGMRIASLVPFVQQNKTAFWAKSTEVDPFGATREVLHLHDFLILQGWEGQPISSRLIDLASLSKNIVPGFPQRLGTVLSGLDDFDGKLPLITTFEPVETLPNLWQNIFGKLNKMGTNLEFAKISVGQDCGNDLAAARNGKFSPLIDGSLQLICQDGVLQAAEDIAAWLAVLAEEEGLQDTVIIGSDAVLDSALHRFGLPVTGAAEESSNSLLQLLPLVLAMGQNPPDPARILELLTLPSSPVPASIGRKLCDALGTWPALGNELWKEKLAEGLATIEDPNRRERIEDRLKILFTPAMDGEYPVVEMKRRVEMLTLWLRGRFQDDAIVHPALNQCHIFLAMIEAMGLAEVNEPLLKKLLDEALSAIISPPSLPAQAGLAAVAGPEAVVGEVKRAVWWNFSRDTVPALATPLLSEKETKALENIGIVLPDSAMQASARAARWRRPLNFTSQQLILVCPRQDAAGEEIYPHPLWDELLAASEDEAKILTASKVLYSQQIPTITKTLLPLPHPETHWQLTPGTVKPRDVESPSSLENFIGCPLSWSLRYNARIRGGHMATLPDIVPTLGSLAHELIEKVLLQETLLSPDDGARLAGALFDQKAPNLVAALFQEGMEAEREGIRNTVVLAARSLLRHLHSAGASKLTVEKELAGTFGSQQLKGRADIVVDKPFTVIDLKRSGAKFFKEKMSSGTALQIVMYGWMLKEAKGKFPEIAYYTLEDQIFLSTDVVHFPDGEEVETPAIEDVWLAFEETFKEAWQLLNSGLVLCPGNGDEVKSKLDDKLLILEPPCRFCDYDVLCGRRFQ